MDNSLSSVLINFHLITCCCSVVTVNISSHSPAPSLQVCVEEFVLQELQAQCLISLEALCKAIKLNNASFSPQPPPYLGNLQSDQ